MLKFYTILISLFAALASTIYAKSSHFYYTFIENIYISKFDNYLQISIEYLFVIIFYSVLILYKRNYDIRLFDEETIIFIISYPAWLIFIYLFLNFFESHNLLELLSNLFYAYFLRIFIIMCIISIYLAILNLIKKMLIRKK